MEAWCDETHVEQGRALYRANFDIAEDVLERRYGYRRPQGGFFLWLDMSPMGAARPRQKPFGKGVVSECCPESISPARGASGDNPGANHVRVALVHDPETTGEALTRIVATLG